MSKLKHTPIRFGVWAPVSGFFGSDQYPGDPVDASYRRNRGVISLAESLGFDATLLLQQTVSTRKPDIDVLETWTSAAALAEATSKIEIIAAIKPFLFNPGILAKMAINIDNISSGRFSLNVVSGWFLPEMRRLGIGPFSHDDRYVLSREWLEIVGAVFAGRRISLDGKFLRAEELELHPSPVRPGGPRIYLGGESEQARQLAADHADVFFINGRSHTELGEIIREMAARPRMRDPLAYGLSGYVIARATQDEARAEFERQLALVDRLDMTPVVQGADPNVRMTKINEHVPSVGTNGGTNAGLVGSYDQVAERIARFSDQGIELFMLQFQPIEAELHRFAENVIPRVRALRG